jgi:hypothetical protein
MMAVAMGMGWPSNILDEGVRFEDINGRRDGGDSWRIPSQQGGRQVDDVSHEDCTVGSVMQ